MKCQYTTGFETVAFQCAVLELVRYKSERMLAAFDELVSYVTEGAFM